MLYRECVGQNLHARIGKPVLDVWILCPSTQDNAELIYDSTLTGP